MTTAKTTPAKFVITSFGGVRPLARLLKIEPSSVCRWDKPREKGGSNGNVPGKYHPKLKKLAVVQGVELTDSDLSYRE